jgi:8-oxo-dGTP diphosphatase
MTSSNPKLQTATSRIYHIVSGIKPLDEFEQSHINDTISWIASGAPLFRITKPDVPNKHLVSYFVVYDESASKVLLVDHKLSGLWLPPGGHVDIDEDPKETVRRECLEELQIQAEFWCDDPIFLTSTITVGLTAGHTDVSLWYVLKGSSEMQYNFDPDEFNRIQWFGFDEIPFEKSDPHMGRFIEKL